MTVDFSINYRNSYKYMIIAKRIAQQGQSVLELKIDLVVISRKSYNLPS